MCAMIFRQLRSLEADWAYHVPQRIVDDIDLDDLQHRRPELTLRLTDGCAPEFSATDDEGRIRSTADCSGLTRCQMAEET